MQAEIAREIESVSDDELRAYLQGALKDATFSRLHRTHRFSQREREWLETIRSVLERLGHRAWIYREGSRRLVHVCETSAPFLSLTFDARPLIGTAAGIAYVRGYFDAEGGMPQSERARLYLSLSQKNRPELGLVRGILMDAGLGCGALHDPSARVDPAYWRFYVRAGWHRTFLETVSSWHPRKRVLMNDRLGSMVPM